MFDVAKVRKDFPILEEQVYGKRLVYLDNGATTQRPLQVIEKMNEYYLKYNSNVHRGVHFLSNKCTDANEEAREIVRKFIHAGSDKEIIFTRGTTESINLVAFSFGEAFSIRRMRLIDTSYAVFVTSVPSSVLLIYLRLCNLPDTWILLPTGSSLTKRAFLDQVMHGI